MALRQLLLPWDAQPQEAARINPRHWLADGLVFATDGREGFVWHQPTTPAVYGLRSLPVATSGPLGGLFAWVPDGTNITRWDIPEMAANGTTLACWVQGVASTSTDTVLSLSNSSASNGARVITRLSTEVYAARRMSSSLAAAGDASATAADNYWHFVVAVFISDAASDLWLNGVQAAAGSGNSRVATTMNTVVIGAAIPNGSQYETSTTAIRGIGPAYLINRALSANEALAWSYEALADPWAMFDEQRIWVPGASVAPSLPTLSALTTKPGTLTSTGFTTRVTAS